LHSFLIDIALQTLDLLLKDASYINFPNNEGQTPLMLAVKFSHLSIVKLLIERQIASLEGNEKSKFKIDLLCPPSCLSSMIDIAIVNNRIPVIETLLEIGSRPRCWEGYAQFFEYCFENHLSNLIYTVLVLADEVFIKGFMKSTKGFPLMTASLHGNLEIFELLAYYSDVPLHEIRISNSSTLLHSCANGGSIEIAELILSVYTQKATENLNLTMLDFIEQKRFQDGFTALHIASMKGHALFVQFLLSIGAQINALDRSGSTPLMLATRAGYDDVILELVSNENCNIHLESIHGHSAIQFAAQRYCNNWNVLTSLIDHGCKLPQTHTASLMRSAAREQTSLHLSILVNAGGNVNASTASGHCALHDAALLGGMDVVTYLLDHGADVNVKTNNGERPLHMAAKRGRCDVVRLLLERGANVRALTEQPENSTAVHVACARGHISVMKILLISCWGLAEQSDGNGRTPLHIAVDAGHIDVARVLLKDYNVSTSTVTKEGYTPLWIAVTKVCYFKKMFIYD
jgi:ankyrin repeat protein